MAKTINLDAMIPRADFSEVTVIGNKAEQILTLNLSQLTPESFLVPSLRKPDFQRETTQWTAAQIVTFLKSFLDNELVPSIILWRSPEKLFVIDGAHRVSALLAWINDDYGDKLISRKFFENKISNEQAKQAASLRKKIDSEIGSFATVRAAMHDTSTVFDDELLVSRANNAKTRALSLQWVEGDAEKAETSFFKINKQGTPLDTIEERLLRERAKPIAIAARSIMRAGTGHEYWSKFEKDIGSKIVKLSSEVHSMLFAPEIEYPVKTLNLPHGGKSSPISAYNLLMDLISYVVVGDTAVDRKVYIYQDDTDGQSTLKTLEACIKVMKCVTGDQPSSLGLHPAVYFYNANGRHMDTIFLGFIKAVARALRENNREFFKKFTSRRSLIEKIFLENKSLLNQANSAIYSAKRVGKWAEFFHKCIDEKVFDENYTQETILEALDLKGKVIASEVQEVGSNFSNTTKSAIFLSNSIDTAQKCPLCNGLIQVEKSASYDHIIAKDKGGNGALSNVQITHPYCNSLKGNE